MFPGQLLSFVRNLDRLPVYLVVRNLDTTTIIELKKQGKQNADNIKPNSIRTKKIQKDKIIMLQRKTLYNIIVGTVQNVAFTSFTMKSYNSQMHSKQPPTLILP